MKIHKCHYIHQTDTFQTDTQTILYAKTLSYSTKLFIHMYLPITNAVSWWFEQDITWPISW